MFFNEGGDVMSCFDEGYIKVFDSFNVCDNNKVHDIIRWRRRRRTPARRSRRPMIPTEVIHPLVFFSLLTLPSTVLSSTNLYVLNLVRHVEKEKNFHVNQHYDSISHPS